MTRIFYNSDNKRLHVFNTSHACYYANNKASLHKGFDYYIRGITKGNTLYLRLYYPYNDIDEQNYTFIKQSSYELLKASENDIVKALKYQAINITETILNVSNEDLKDKLKLQYV